MNQPLPPADVLAGDAAALVRELAAAGAPTPPNLSRGELLQAVLALRLARGEPVAVAGAPDLMPEGFGVVGSPALDFASWMQYQVLTAPTSVAATTTIRSKAQGETNAYPNKGPSSRRRTSSRATNAQQHGHLAVQARQDSDH